MASNIKMPSKSLPKKKNARFGKSRPGKGSGSGSQNGPQRSRIHANVHLGGLVVMTVLKEATINGQAFIGDLTAAIEDDQSFCEEYMCLGSFALRCAVSGEVKTFKTANNKTYAQKCLVFFVDSDEDVTEKVKIVCELFSKVTKPYVSKTGVVGRPHLGVPGKILVVLGRMISRISSRLSGLTRQLILWGVFTTGIFWTGQWTLTCFKSTLGVPSTGSMQKSWSLRPLKKTRV